MPSGIPIEIAGLSKHFGPVTAVEDLSFTVQPGRVTGFLGPNGAGKTTTLRVLLGLVHASARRWRMPSEYPPTRRSANSAMPTWSSTIWTRAFDRPAEVA